MEYFIRRDNYERHLETAKHKNTSKVSQKEGKSKPKVSLNDPKSKPKVSIEGTYDCKYCGKSFKHKQYVSKHIKYSCPKNKDEDLHP